MEKSYDSLSIAIRELKKLGYTVDFNLHENGLESKHHHTTYCADDLDVVNYYRFEGMTNPSDSSILYVIHTKDGRRGLLVDSYGATESEVPADVLQKLKIKPDTFSFD